MRVLRLLIFLILILCPVFTAAQDSPDSSISLPMLADVARSLPASDAARHALEDGVSRGLPDSLSPAIIGSLPVTSEPVPGGLGMLIVPNLYLVTRASEPQHGASFVKITYLYSSNGTLFCRVHYQTPDDAPLASRIARLLALFHQTLTASTGQEPLSGDAPIDIWLCREGMAGGEQWQRNLYFYDLDAKRSSIEWIREIAHEYSHLALPPIGGYKDPEYWANGYLGERLLIRWLQHRPDGPALVAQVWGDFSGARNFDSLLIAPAVALYKHMGPNTKWLARTDAEGMRYLIGQTLTMDDKYGARTLAAAFALLPRESTAADLADAFAQVTAHPAVANNHP